MFDNARVINLYYHYYYYVLIVVHRLLLKYIVAESEPKTAKLR